MQGLRGLYSRTEGFFVSGFGIGGNWLVPARHMLTCSSVNDLPRLDSVGKTESTGTTFSCVNESHGGT